jgi:hypothetical protein
MLSFAEQDQVAIVAGTYKGCRDTYLGAAGFYGLSAKVRVNGDSQLSRTICLTSLEAIVVAPTSPPRPTPASCVVINKARHIQRLVTDLVLCLEAMTVPGRALQPDT